MFKIMVLIVVVMLVGCDGSDYDKKSPMSTIEVEYIKKGEINNCQFLMAVTVEAIELGNDLSTKSKFESRSGFEEYVLLNSKRYGFSDETNKMAKVLTSYSFTPIWSELFITEDRTVDIIKVIRKLKSICSSDSKVKSYSNLINYDEIN